ncbi:uncharacterized protein LOC133844705 [Drosophila sulfurigaster albostrigata]|uniref:uncharacterized protein LOC133844705 n=1 Tax=Drosophila sulfurigaster albostrigata TaxID=89887 RepID=UPI002D21E4B7|nr:uncharacterized protein LOC133844705 [Drosophila sulfurigaster albostrigata]
MDACKSLLNRNKIDPILKRMVTGDEKWITYDNVKRERLWSKSGEAAQTVAKPGLTARKVHLCVCGFLPSVRSMSSGRPDKTKARLSVPSTSTARVSSNLPVPRSKGEPALRASSTLPVHTKREVPARSASVSPTSGTKPLILVTKPPSVPKTKVVSDPIPRPAVTRSQSKMAQNVVDSALNKFIAATDRLSHFAARLNNVSTDSASLYTCQVRRDQMRALWDKVEKEYEACSCVMSDEMTTDELPTIQAKYDYCYILYEQWSAQLSEQIADASQALTPRTPVQPPAVPFVSTGCRLPPCDTEVFGGDYTRWPTFRDLFTAIYIRNPRLSEVEKLFHLNSKTSGEAHAIVSKSPLTNEGFQSAWSSLTERFENKRLLVNSQLRILFNLPAIGQESGAAIQELQSTIQGCLTALEHSKINTENWDCILVFLCSLRLPKLTLSLWEQSIQNKSDVPTWADMNDFLLERYRTLEAIAEVSASTSAPTVPRASRKEAPVAKQVNSFESRVTSKTQSCKLCSRENHPIRLCPRFLQMGINDRSANVQSFVAVNTQGVLLSTAVIHVCHLGVRYTARALIDSGSEATFLSEKLFKRLRMPYTSVQARVSGLTQAVAAQPRKFCQFLIGSPVRPDLQIEASAIQLADPKFHESSQIDVLLGADILPSILLGGSHPNICGTLLGQETIFGWILTGPVSGSISKSISSFSARLSVERTPPLEELLSKFWEVEDLPASPAKESDLFCEANFNATTVRTSTGRYMVTLPFRDPGHVDLGHSRATALAQFLRNESRLKRNDSLKEQYDSVIREYLDLGHMTQVPPSSSGNYYLPHHAVLKPDSTTTKLRVVFNASSPTSNGKSLNDILHTGPILQSDLTIQILKWRFSNEKLCDFELNTVTFGVNCAPYLAIRVLHQLANDVRDRYPLASDIIANYMYVDDVLAGAHTKQAAVSAIDELRTALESAGFPLRKWTSNSKDVLRRIPKDHLLCADFLEIDEASVAKTLGIRWRATSDEFFFVTAEMVSKPSFSKREVLSQIAKLFDPAGWLAPVVIWAKIFMQEIWKQEIGWDDSLPADLTEQWTSFLRNYSSLQDIRIPRWTNYAPGAKIQFHGFCDASQSAYGAALYARVETAGQVSVSLLAAKTRVAPIKTVSLPRLELCGALLLAELSAALLPHFPTPDAETYLWTDSTIVLAWLDKQPCKWTTFVANRVAKIHSVNSTWQHVRSEHNPADLASRGVSPQELLGSRLWWQGPEWLTHSPAQWPSPVIGLDTELECRAVKVHAAQVLCEDFLDRFSRFDRALRVFAYVRRFAQRCRQPKVSFPETLSSQELAEAQERLIVQAQNRVYAKECASLRSHNRLIGSSDILSLNPFLDKQGVLRSCGRVRASTSLSYDERHPIILPFGCVFSRLLVSFTHQVSLHGGNQLVMRLVRTKFWIPKLRNLVKTVISACKTCVIHRRKIQSQLMGDLPTARSTFSRPFTNSGVDFAGPFDVKSYVGRGCKITKGYVCVFVCFSTKAIHLEATTDLTAEKFLEAFSRFVARRGCPLHMYSDNGKTFVGASSILSKEFVESTRNLIVTTHSHQGLAWHFNPPGAPHMGGLWEAGVKSFKTHFYKTVSSVKHTFEELSTLLSKIEACLNSRPLTPMSEDVSDLAALTPGHFLIGGPLLSMAEPESREDVESIRNRWQRLKALHQHFCVRWKSEYLKELHKRNKWQSPSRDLQIGDMVVIREENIPPQEWRLGRVLTACPGADERVRVVDIQTCRGVFRRPVAKLVLLPTGRAL